MTTLGPATKEIDLTQAPAVNPYRRSRIVELCWHLAELAILRNPLVFGTWPRITILRVFGARVGRKVVAPWPFRVHMAWNLSVGNNCWIGDGAWFHNQGPIVVGDNVVISQQAFLTTGTHDINNDMALVIRPIRIQAGAWITTRSFVSPGTTIGEGVILTPLSVARGHLDSFGIYAGNPAKRVSTRKLD